MKTLKNTLLIGLMTLLLSPLSFAQDFDKNRMSRDIKIMENILDEVFKIEAKSTNSGSSTGNIAEVKSLSGNLYFSAFGARSNQVSGNYIPGYGIIFKVPYLLSGKISSVEVTKGKGEPSISFYYDSNDSPTDNHITEETVIARITEFLKNYAPTIGQLDSNERIIIVYGEKKQNTPHLRIYSLSGNQNTKEKVEQIPVITVSVRASDLAALRNGSLTSDNFENRLSISKAEEEKERLDLEVMKNILGTAFEEGDGESFHLINSNSISYLSIDDFGVHYTLDMHRGHGLQSSFAFGAVTSFRETNSDEAENSARKIQEVREERENTVKTEYQNLLDQMKQYLVDYGRTLSSLSLDQFLLVTANITDHRDIVPSQVNFQLKKLVLSQLDRGQISREDAINAVTITEY